MEFLHIDNYKIIINDDIITNTKEIVLKINNTKKSYIGKIPKILNIHGFKKYKFDEQFIKFILELEILNIVYNDFDGLMYICIDNFIFDDGKKYPYIIKIEMKRFFTIDKNIDETNDISDLKQIVKSFFDYIKILENKVYKLEQQINDIGS
jgi:hypothetical protein